MKEMSNYKEINSCVVCKKDGLKKYLNLGMQPLANSYHKGVRQPTFPLGVQFCANCNHSMLTASVNPEIMFSDYLYISDTSKTLTDYFQGLCDNICARNQDVAGKSILEIACNSGLFLEMFKKKGMECFGVDPAANLRNLSAARELDVAVEFWDLAYAKSLAEDKKFDIIIAVHVLPHVPDPVAFLQACKHVLKPGGKIYIQTSQCEMFLNNEFDAIYHEHVSYFTALSFRKTAELSNLVVSDAWKAPIHSSSFVFELTDVGNHGSAIQNLCEEEIKLGRDNLTSYYNFRDKATKISTELTNLLGELKKKNIKVVGYGASAKGNTLLNWLQKKLDYIVDDSNLKWDYLTPGMDVPICSPEKLYQEKEPVAILCLAWNFFDEIHKNVCTNTSVQHKFITYFPCVQVK